MNAVKRRSASRKRCVHGASIAFVRAHPQAHAYLTARRVCWEQKEDAAAGKKPMGGAIVRRDPLNKDRC
jgi:hypothetical protein